MICSFSVSFLSLLSCSESVFKYFSVLSLVSSSEQLPDLNWKPVQISSLMHHFTNIISLTDVPVSAFMNIVSLFCVFSLFEQKLELLLETEQMQEMPELSHPQWFSCSGSTKADKLNMMRQSPSSWKNFMEINVTVEKIKELQGWTDAPELWKKRAKGQQEWKQVETPHLQINSGEQPSLRNRV